MSGDRNREGQLVLFMAAFMHNSYQRSDVFEHIETHTDTILEKFEAALSDAPEKFTMHAYQAAADIDEET